MSKLKLEVENNNNVTVWYLVNYANSLLYVNNSVAIISVDLSLKQKTVSVFKIITESDIGFYNNGDLCLFNDMHLYALFDYMVILIYMVYDLCYI